MAILGQIRKRSFVLIVVIGMSLFAFVISGVFIFYRTVNTKCYLFSRSSDPIQQDKEELLRK